MLQPVSWGALELSWLWKVIWSRIRKPGLGTLLPLPPFPQRGDWARQPSEIGSNLGLGMVAPFR